MVKEVSLAMRNRAVGMLKGGMTQRQVADDIGVTVRTIRGWWLRYKKGDSLKNRIGRGRKTVIGRIPKIVLAKNVGKRQISTRKLSQILKSKGFPVSHVTIHTYLRKSLKLKPYKPRIQPRLTENQRIARLKFCQERKEWSVNEWQRVIFSDESPFELFHPPNRQNDRIWSDCREKVPHFRKSQISRKIASVGGYVTSGVIRTPFHAPTSNC